MLAGSLHRWFRLEDESRYGAEAGLPIWFRARVEGEGTDARISPSIPWSDAVLNVVIILADDHMVADKRWRYALEHLRSRAGDALILPVAVDYSFYRLSGLYQLNPIRIGDPRPSAAGDPPPREHVEKRARLLRRDVTDAIIRSLRTRDAALPPPLEVFISHAKQDGTVIAEAIRDKLASLGQMRAWYDANELPPGYGWSMPMEKAVEDGTAVLLSVVTDSYPTRYWCRREATLARTPRRLSLDQPRSGVSAWTLQPTLAVHQALGVWSRPMAQLAQVPRIGWPTDDGAIAERVADVVDRVLLETLLVTFYRAYARSLADSISLAEDHELVLLTWVPDPWSLVSLAGKIRGQLLEREVTALIFAYPGHGLRTAEQVELLGLLESVFPAETGLRVHLVSQERLPQFKRQPVIDAKIALSAGGTHADLEGAGVSPDHVSDLLIRLSRRLLQSQCKLFYGGVLGSHAADFTDSLLEATRGWAAECRIETQATVEYVDEPPLINYSVWPYYHSINLRDQAQLTGLCRFIKVTPPGKPNPPAKRDADKPEHAQMQAEALSEMRRLTSASCVARVVLGGKISGWSGWLPGVVEEVVCTLEHDSVAIVLGGYGGCAEVMAGYLQQPTSAWPEELSFAAAASNNPSFATLISTPDRNQIACDHFVRAEASIKRFRAQLHDPGTWPFAFPREIILELLVCRRVTHTINRVLEGLACATQSGASTRPQSRS